MTVEITCNKTNIHSKTLFNKVDEHIKALIAVLDIDQDLETMVTLIEMMIIEEAETYKLEQINIIADTRNNKQSDLKNGKIKIEIYYKHFNCYNVTKLLYNITKEET